MIQLELWHGTCSGYPYDGSKIMVWYSYDLPGDHCFLYAVPKID